MKIVKIIIGCTTILISALTMSFSMTNVDSVNINPVNDCWSSFARHQAGLPADMSTDQCVGVIIVCCVQPNPNVPGQYVLYSMN